MNHNGHPLSRRRLLVGTAAASAVTLAGVTGAQAAATAGPPRATAPLVSRDRIASALLRIPGGSLAAARFQVDFHEGLAAWLAFWSANSPRDWGPPAELVAEVDPGGGALTLHAIRYRRVDELRDGFAAGLRDATHRATLASLHHHFPGVRPLPGGAVRVTHGAAGFTGSTEQVAFAVAACRELWGDRAATTAGWQGYANRALARVGQRTDVTSRAGWATFTRTSLRRGLGTESYE